MTVFKKLSSKRALTIPKVVAESLGFFGGEAVDISVGDSSTILIRKHVPVCVFCGSKDHVVTYNGKDCCAECAAKLAKAVS